MSLAGSISGGTRKDPQVARTSREEGRYTWGREDITEKTPFLLDIAPIGGGKLIWTLTLTTFSDELSVEIFFKLN